MAHMARPRQVEGDAHCRLEFADAQCVSAVPIAEVRTVLHPKEVAALPAEAAEVCWGSCEEGEMEPLYGGRANMGRHPAKASPTFGGVEIQLLQKRHPKAYLGIHIP